ncbi:MAG: hypothetical protein AB1896_22880 [Thermodesulfobacteriota bacterium]
MKKLFVLALALGLAIAMAAPAFAAVKISGDLRQVVSWTWEDKYWNYNRSGVQNELFRVADMTNGYSRIKVNYQSDDKKYIAYYELGTESKGYTNTNRVRTRHAYFEYNWGKGNILFGQTGSIKSKYGPVQWLNDLNGFIGYGWHYYDRYEQIRLTMGDKYKFQFAIERPAYARTWQGAIAYNTQANPWPMGTTYAILPAMSAAGTLNFGNVEVVPWVGWEWIMGQNVAGTAASPKDDSFHSLDGGVAINGEFGIFGFTVAGFAGYNPKWSQAGSMASALARPSLGTDGKIKDNVTGWGGYVDVRVAGLEAGLGYSQKTRSGWKKDPYTYAAFINYTIPFGMISFVPEIAYFNNGKADFGSGETDYGQAIFAGVLCRMKF